MDFLFWLFTVKLLHIHSMHHLDHRKVLPAQSLGFPPPKCYWSYLYSCYLFIEESICTLVVTSFFRTSLNPPECTVNSQDCLSCWVIHCRLCFDIGVLLPLPGQVNKIWMRTACPTVLANHCWTRGVCGAGKGMHVQVGKLWLSCSSCSYD